MFSRHVAPPWRCFTFQYFEEGNGIDPYSITRTISLANCPCHLTGLPSDLRKKEYSKLTPVTQSHSLSKRCQIPDLVYLPIWGDRGSWTPTPVLTDFIAFETTNYTNRCLLKWNRTELNGYLMIFSHSCKTTYTTVPNYKWISFCFLQISLKSIFCTPNRIWTCDLTLKMSQLYQLRYKGVNIVGARPESNWHHTRIHSAVDYLLSTSPIKNTAGKVRFELATSGLRSLFNLMSVFLSKYVFIELYLLRYFLIICTSTRIRTLTKAFGVPYATVTPCLCINY